MNKIISLVSLLFSIYAFSAPSQSQKPSCRDFLITQAQEKIIYWMTVNKKVPSGIKEWASTGVNYSRFVGAGTYARNNLEQSSRLHSSPQEAFEKLLLKTQESEDFLSLGELDRQEIIINLRIKAGDDFAVEEKRQKIISENYTKIIDWIFLHKKVPAGFQEWSDVGVNYSKLTGEGDYVPTGESYKARLNDNPESAFSKVLEKFESSEKLDSLTEKEKNEILLELRIRSGNPNAISQKTNYLRREAYEKILRFTIENRKIPAGFKEWISTDVNYGKFVGGGDYSKGGESHASRLHDNPPAAFRGLYYFAEASPLFEATPELKAEILQIIAKRHQNAFKRYKRRLELDFPSE